jgi:carboxypeptidase PM20D1
MMALRILEGRMKKIAQILAALVGGVVLVAGVRTCTLSSQQPQVEPLPPAEVDAGAAGKRLGEAIRYRTISHFDRSQLDRGAFLALHRFLQRTYPAAHGALDRERVDDLTLLYTWPGRDPSRMPVALLAHQDVVPVPPETSERWTQPAFEGVIDGGFVWGRGAMDDKGNLMAILEAAERLAAGGFTPARTVYLAFGHDEEVGGTGATAVAALLAERGIELDFVLDEGLAVIEGMIPGLAQPVAMIGVVEKGYLSLRLVVEQPGGHSSTPPRQTAVGILAAAITRLERAPLPARLEGVPRAFVGYLAPETPLRLRVVLSNLWLFEGILKRFLASTPGTNAVIRTTTAPTMLSGSPKDNVLPNRAEGVVNFRILPGDTIASVTEHVRAAIADDRVKVEPIGHPREPSRVSSTESESFGLLQRSIGRVFPDAVVAPNLVLGGTDARHYGDVAQDVYRFAPYRFGPGDLARAHGIDERIGLEQHADAIRFYELLLQSLD